MVSDLTSGIDEETRMRLATALVLSFTFGASCAVPQDESPKPKVSKAALSDEQLAVYLHTARGRSAR